jgi:hypothetical protein
LIPAKPEPAPATKPVPATKAKPKPKERQPTQARGKMAQFVIDFFAKNPGATASQLLDHAIDAPSDSTDKRKAVRHTCWYLKREGMIREDEQGGMFLV